MNITPRVSFLTILGIIPTLFFKTIITIIIWMTLITLLCIFDYLTIRNFKNVTVTRLIPKTIRKNEKINIKVIITNPTKNLINAIITNSCPPSIKTNIQEQKIIIASDTQTNINFEITPKSRGKKTIQQLTIRAFGKLKLISIQKKYDTPRTVMVTPEFKSRKYFPSKLLKLQQIEGNTASFIKGKGAEFDSMRKYVIGDDIRDIDWRASTKHQELIVKSWHPEQDRKILLLLDISRLSSIVINNESRLESQIEACLLLTSLAIKAHDQIEILLVSNKIEKSLQPSHKIDNLMQTLASYFINVFSQFKEITWTDHIPYIKSRMKNNGIIIFITPIDQNTYTNGLIKTALNLNKKHTIIIASVYKNEINAIKKVTNVYDKAAIISSKLIRDEIKKKFTMNKIHIIEAEPNEFPSKLCDKYLEIKSKIIY